MFDHWSRRTRKAEAAWLMQLYMVSGPSRNCGLLRQVVALRRCGPEAEEQLGLQDDQGCEPLWLVEASRRSSREAAEQLLLEVAALDKHSC